MSDFKNTTRMISGHHHWDGSSVWDGRPTQTPPKNPVALTRTGAQGAPIRHPMAHAAGGPVPHAHDDIHGAHEKGGVRDFHSYGEDHALLQRKTPVTDELEEAGGTSPLRSGFKKGGLTKHFHVHKHFHAKGGRTHSVSRSYSVAEKSAEKYAEGGHVINDTTPPAGGPDYKKGGRTKSGKHVPVKVKKNAGGALYATGGTVNKLAMGGIPTQGAVPPMGLNKLAVRPQGLPNRAAPALRRPVAMPGPQPMVRKRGGGV